MKMPGFLFWTCSVSSLILIANGRYAILPWLLSCMAVWYSLNKILISPRIHQILLVSDFRLALLNVVVPQVLQFVKWIWLPGLGFWSFLRNSEELLSPVKSWYIKCSSDLLVNMATFLSFSMKSQCICLEWNSGIKFVTFPMALPLAVSSSSSLFKGNFKIKFTVPSVITTVRDSIKTCQMQKL